MADAQEGSAREVWDAGFDAFLPKPVVKDELAAVIRTVLGDTREEKTLVTRHTACEVSLAGIRVLVAEDVPANWELMLTYLDMFECVAAHAANGKEAVEMVRAHDYDVCLMDMQMPVMDGLQAARAIRKDLGKDIPIIALTAAIMEEDRGNAKFAGMNDFLIKPVDLKLLKATILKWGKRRT